LYAWVGGSLAGSLKVGGEEIGREEWDEGYETSAFLRAREEGFDGAEGDVSLETENFGRRERRGKRLQDWSRAGFA
jgi:actin-related protein 10